MELEEFFWQALTFSSVAFGFVVISAWWLYFSPMRERQSIREFISPKISMTLSILLILWALLLLGGAFWDASMHIETGEIPAGADFLWPPHIMIYSAFAMSFAVGAASIGRVARDGLRRGNKDPRSWVRSSPFMGALALASLYSLLSIPGDAIWHELYGVDLTAWSPPHLILGLMSSIVIICAIKILVESRPRFKNPTYASNILLILLAMLLNVAYMIGVIEWELPGTIDSLVAARPQWFYPLVAGAIGFFVLQTGKLVVPLRWAATIIAVIFHSVRLAITLVLSLTGHVAPYLPLNFMVAAILLDIVPFQKISFKSLRNVARALVFTVGFVASALPLVSSRFEISRFSNTDQFLSALSIFIAAAIIGPLTSRIIVRFGHDFQ